MSHLYPSDEDVRIAQICCYSDFEVCCMFLLVTGSKGDGQVSKALPAHGVRYVFISRAWESSEFRRKHRFHNYFGNLQEQRSSLDSRLWR